MKSQNEEAVEVDRGLNVESFNLDHCRVQAPYVRVADRRVLPGGDVLIKYDVRFTQPNVEHLEMDAVHSIEHMTAHHMRNHTDALIDFSPMGCQTGFYALTLELEFDEFSDVLEATFKDILGADAVPAANEIQCGWGANHSLQGAQREVAKFLEARDTWHIVEENGSNND
ncbi:S-ribosylhomocysteine lyase [Actinomyces minihominis]|uniref:S-ribosylhomocysteine lyase n=1 Tax=Actinomyces minihominis TaxID=2002838 RepID=UPI000C06ACED|nr:S-ribosylhomocysteine lyase [Actinomyces minihominis]